jgi:hypothetical protein
MEPPAESGALGPAGPGDSGPCPICGQDMAEKVYEERLLDGITPCRGRYWHMVHEHGILEDYAPPGFG